MDEVDEGNKEEVAANIEVMIEAKEEKLDRMRRSW